MSATKTILEPGREYPPPGEEADIERIEHFFRQKLEQDNPPGARPTRRGQHSKTHGCVRAEFIVHEDIAPQLRHGIFREPRTYAAWVRFSPSAAPMRADTRGDAHGMAVKLMGVAGQKLLEEEQHATTQDFVMANSRVFFVRNAADYVDFADAFANGKTLSYFFGWNPLRWRWREFRILLAVIFNRVSNPLQIQYWSQTAFRLGPHAMKFSARPQLSKVDLAPVARGPDYLRAAMAQQLKTEEVRFDFLVQLQTDPVRMPVEDATIVWDETLSPFRKVATIRIPPQTFDSPAQVAFAENLSFSPWHALPEHQPLGAMNRTRRRVYAAISKRRHEMNNVPRQEPTDSEIFDSGP